MSKRAGLDAVEAEMRVFWRDMHHLRRMQLKTADRNDPMSRVSLSFGIRAIYRAQHLRSLIRIRKALRGRES